MDLAAEFIQSHGQATSMLPVNFGGVGMTTVLYKFRDRRAIVVMVHAPEPAHLAGPFACRIFMDLNQGTPDRAKFAQLVHWCANSVTLGNVESGAVVTN
ncbi:MAG: hypothetical protein AVDCRST_MAG91-2003 [uncultured Sphingomonadaceae bacterium]|uniref:Uncharacterized protein n=1 Tax=uncultured Sphingomonadaceae bacterium TaxID=169976 RepID=A0A6J4TAZ1_9SPHN|nr:MAG: hypothetical protein AVDCRST_MAG91-2003 [uncultured Sphingomonadaceae bacterium]